MEGRSSAAGLTGVVLLSIVAVGAAQATRSSASAYAAESEASPTTSVEDAARVRAKYGLPSDEATVEQIMSDPDNVIEDWPGIYVTPAEREALDLSGRMVFAAAVATDLVPYLEEQQTLAGYWFDQAENGQLVVALTEQSSEVEEAITERLPSPSKGVEFVTRQRTLAEVRQASDRVWEVWEEAGLAAPYSVGVIPPTNGLRVSVYQREFEAAAAEESDLEAQLGVPLTIEGVTDPGDLSCNRADCDDKFRAGFLLYNDYMFSGRICTAAFILHNEDWVVPYQVLTAGHCWRVPLDEENYTWDTGGAWYNSYDNIGPSKNWDPYLYGESHQTSGSHLTQDIMRIGITGGTANIRDSVYLAGGTQQMWLPIGPVYGAPACASFGYSDYTNSDGSDNGIHCGTISEPDADWVSGRGSWHVYGAAMEFDDNYRSIPGDSGSPIYEYYDGGGVRTIYPIGVADSRRKDAGPDDVYFAKVVDALGSRWGSTWDDATVWQMP